MSRWLGALLVAAVLTLPSLFEPPLDRAAIHVAAMTAAVPTVTPTATRPAVEALTTRVVRLERTAVAFEAAKNRLETRHGMHDGKIRALEERASQLELWRREFVEWRGRLDAWLMQVQLAWGRGR